MQNALEELKERFLELKIIAAKVSFDDGDFVLPIGHDSKQAFEFNQFMDREYDSGYGGQELFGTLWFSDGTWATRGEYDGSEWWVWHKRPEPPLVA